MPRESAGGVSGALSGDGAGHLVTSPVRKQRSKKSKKELAEEAARILREADKLNCIAQDSGVQPEKFYTLPNRKKKKYDYGSIDRKIPRRNSLEIEPAPKKPPRTFANSPPLKPSVFDLFKKTEKPKTTGLRRSVSDASTLKSKTHKPTVEYKSLPRRRTGSDTEDKFFNHNKKQLTPIIEDAIRDDYFANAKNEENKENINHEENVDVRPPARKKWKKSESVTESLKKYINEVDEALYRDTGVRVARARETAKEPEIVIIDLDKAQKISSHKNSKLRNSLTKKIKSLTTKKAKKSEDTVDGTVQKRKVEPTLSTGSTGSTSPRIKQAIEELEKQDKKAEMIHSSQKPADRPPLTRGRRVDTMVKRLSNESSSPPPPKPNALITPNISVQHNNNQPFSYTRGLSPDKYTSNEHSPEPGSPIIYAQVVCNNGANGQSKQTIHTAYPNIKKYPQHSDSDEGLGYEEHIFNRRYEKFKNHINSFDQTDDYLDKEAPITPKLRPTGYTNGYSPSRFKTEHNIYIDSSSRGRGDGMDAKRRESLSEPFENGFNPNKMNGSSNINGLSARRDLLESRINRRLADKSLQSSPEYMRDSPPHKSNLYIAETSSKYYRSGSTSPVGYREKYIAETKRDKKGERYISEVRDKHFYGGLRDRIEFEQRHKNNGYGLDSEPKSFDSQLSDYRSSPESKHYATNLKKSTDRYGVKSEKQRLFKDKTIYQSNPEINKRSFLEKELDDNYHNSLRREKHYLTRQESDRKDKFGDSGIENDFRRDSGDNLRSSPPKPKRDYINESEDEGFASSLLIANERQHTDEGAKKNRSDYDSDRAYSREGDRYRSGDTPDYRNKSKYDYVPRERSIDDGSHYDPRIDKHMERDKNGLIKLEKKPPKPEKRGGLEKVIQLFSRDSKKKKEKPLLAREESLRARYREYKGSSEHLESSLKKKTVPEVNTSYNYSNRRKLSTPSPSPTRNGKTENAYGSWFKSLDRLSRKKTKKDEKEGNFTSTEDETCSKPTPTKNLRFFGDTDLESNDSVRYKSSFKSRATPLIPKDRIRSQSSRDLHNISEEIRTPEMKIRKVGVHKSLTDISGSDREGGRRGKDLKPPVSPSHRVLRDYPKKEERSRRRKNEVSSVESSTEGDSSQQSQRSVVYLHAATVGDIPGPGHLRNGRRAASREELASNASSRMQPQVKTLSRSFSVLAPWKPRHYREAMDIDYTQYPKSPSKNGKYEQRPTRNGTSRKENSSTLKKKAHETRKSNQNVSALSEKSRSKENISSHTQTLTRRPKDDATKSSTSTLYKKKDRLPRENSRYNRDREDRKISSKSMSVESLGSSHRTPGKPREEKRDVSRSISMPRDPQKSAGWFKMIKKGKKSESSQRL